MTLYYHEQAIASIRKAAAGWTGDWPDALRYAAGMADTAKALAEVMTLLLEPNKLDGLTTSELAMKARAIISAMPK